MHFNKEQIEAVKQTDLVNLSEAVGFTPRRVGRYYTLKEHDSIIIYNRNTWHRNSTGYQGHGGDGGDPIDFMIKMCGCTFQEAVERLLSFNNFIVKENIERTGTGLNKPGPSSLHKMQLPNRLEGKYTRLYAYLIQTRCIDKNIVDYFVKKHLIYESEERHNIVFCSTDKEGTIKHAFMRGTNDAYPFKGDVEGNDKNYGFNAVNNNSDELNVFEGAIDLMSYMTMYERNPEDISCTNKLALGMLSDHPLETFLKEHPQINKINFWMDNDYAEVNHGQEAAEAYMKKYEELGYQCMNATKKYLPAGYKDVNEFNQAVHKRVLERNQLKALECPRHEQTTRTKRSVHGEQKVKTR